MEELIESEVRGPAPAQTANRRKAAAAPKKSTAAGKTSELVTKGKPVVQGALQVAQKAPKRHPAPPPAAEEESESSSSESTPMEEVPQAATPAVGGKRSGVPIQEGQGIEKKKRRYSNKVVTKREIHRLNNPKNVCKHMLKAAPFRRIVRELVSDVSFRNDDEDLRIKKKAFDVLVTSAEYFLHSVLSRAAAAADKDKREGPVTKHMEIALECELTTAKAVPYILAIRKVEKDHEAAKADNGLAQDDK